jgi:DNA-directed RNA polymerase beta subunit
MAIGKVCVWVIINYHSSHTKIFQNQEDSLVVSQGAIDRGLFNGSKFTFYKTELDQREEFGNPDIATTADIKSASYSKLKDGIVAKGTKLNKGDAIIGKYMRIPKTADQDMTMSDRSIIYKEQEEAIVHNVIVDRNEDDERFAKVAVRKVRPVAIGDKFSSRAGRFFWPEVDGNIRLVECN